MTTLVDEGEEISPEPNAAEPEETSRSSGKVIILFAVLFATLPILVATIRALHNHWLAIGDNALFELRARDVFGHHFPLLGTWTSASQEAGLQLNNPGPIFFDLLAIPSKLFNDAGLACAVASINIASIIGIALVAYRRGGVVPSTAATLMAGGLSWTMGSELLFDPWQPHSMLIPFLFFLVLAWSLACGDIWMLPFAVGVASLVLETHLSYAVLIPIISVWAVGALVWTYWQRRRDDPEGWPAVRRSLRRPIVITLVVAVIAWAQPIVEQLQHGREGNLARLVRSIGASRAKVGFSLGTRVVASVLSSPPLWLRPSFGQSFLPNANTGAVAGVPAASVDVPTVARSVVSIVVLLALLGLCVWWASRNKDRPTAMAAATAIVLVVAGLFTAGTLPESSFGIAPHHFRWLWPMGIFITFALVLTVARWVASTKVGVRPVAIALTSATAVLGLLNMPYYNQNAGPSADAASIPAVHDILSQLGALDGKHTLLLDIHNLRFAEPWDVAITNGLDRRGHEIVVDDPGMIRQFGPARAFDGHADGRLVIEEGDGAVSDHPGMTRVVLHDDLNASEQEERAALQQQLGDMLTSGGLHLTPNGQRAVTQGKIAALEPPADGSQPDPRGLLVGDQIREMLANGWIELDSTWKPRFERYAELQHRWNFQTVAIFLAPVNAQP
jgi:hypothetical protein